MVASLFTAASEALAAAVVDLRNAAGMTQRQLAEAVGREQNYIARIEKAQRRVDLVEWVILCSACKVDPVAEISKLVQRIKSLTPQPHRKSRR